MAHPVFKSRHLPAVLGAILATTWVLLNLDAPLVEDSLFWWVPKAMLAAEGRWPSALFGALPHAIQTNSVGDSLIPQWSGGIPDYGHPPLWYAWVGIFAGARPSIQGIHLACLIPAMAAGAGLGSLGARLGHRWSGLTVFALPPFLAQLLRPELDLGLIAIIPWALIALLDRRWNRFAGLAMLAVLTKEPGVLLAVPACALAMRERRFRWQAVAPLLALLAWGLFQGWLAKPERLPDGLLAYWFDLGTVLQIVFWEQGRWLLLLGLPLLFRNQSIALFVLAWLLFFAGVGFFANRGTIDTYTHIRYLLPGLAVAVVALAGRWPVLSLIGLLWLHSRSVYGPEASLYGVDVARALRQAAPWIRAQQDEARVVWAGTHAAASLTQPWAGTVKNPVSNLRVYSMTTRSDSLPDGNLVLQMSYGEPTGAILQGRDKTAIIHWREHDAVVLGWRLGPEPR